MENQSHLWTLEEVGKQAYDVFLELAPDNLKPEDINKFNEDREELGFIEEDIADESWNAFVEFEIDPEDYAQVIVGLEYDSIGVENKDVIFAKILISRDKAAPFCHVIWKD
ncbi:dsDNA-mimic protein [Pseudoalteromonas sp. NBT06-2]|uniref:HI1450 family dsDNA-mimic protein n=1 Tax=Pseudoalteromonas sp. NBT06-2 TaxID=2025950 RepID=UPI000BA796CA|nr:HI1450 family dsDNA-mimic protein [Pseudoalteromonas sp. NBT06-2]PAJ75741.1 dsDNA-mimic protein [Pseudoalteromonas sp. NBT06-2]